MHVAATGLVQVVAAGSSSVGDGGGHRDVDTQGLAVGHRARTHDHAGRAGAHQVHGGGVVHHSPGDNGDVQRADELLKVQRLTVSVHVLRGDQGALDDKQVDAASDQRWGELTGALRGDTHCEAHTRVTNLLQALLEQVQVQRLLVQALQHLVRGELRSFQRFCRNVLIRPLIEGAEVTALGRGNDLAEGGVEVLRTTPQALCVDDGQPAGLAKLDSELRADHGVGRVRHDREVELIGIDAPGGVHVPGGTRAPRRHDVDLVESEDLACGATAADVLVFLHVGPYFVGQRGALRWCGRRTPLVRGGRLISETRLTRGGGLRRCARSRPMRFSGSGRSSVRWRCPARRAGGTRASQRR